VSSMGLAVISSGGAAPRCLRVYTLGKSVPNLCLTIHYPPTPRVCVGGLANYVEMEKSGSLNV
jgi:hypothetical protein